ncbi:hypothetical protein ACFYP4_27375 [Streptomyces sp. NPDC005551]
MTTPQQLLVEAAARNNAEGCAAMSRSHGLAAAIRHGFRPAGPLRVRLRG